MKAVLIFDPNRRPEQLAYAAERAEILYEAGDQVWVTLTQAQADRLAEQGIVVQLHEDADLVELPAIVFDPAGGTPEPPPQLRAAEPAGGERAHYLVQFIAPLAPGWIHEITQLGGIFVQNLPVNVGVFRLSASEAAAVGQLAYVPWLGIYHPAYAVSYQLAGREQPFTAASLRELAVDAGSLPSSPAGNARIRLFDDVDPDEARAAIEAAGVAVTAGSASGFVVSADAARLTDLLRRTPGILAVERFFARRPTNNRGGVIMGVSEVRSFGNVGFLVNLDGRGEVVGVVDSGLDTGTVTPALHADIRGRVLQISNTVAAGTPVPDNAANNGPHGTHVTGTIAGDGTGSAGRVRGMAPACQIVFHGSLAGDTFRALENAHTAGARVHNNSWGTSPSSVCPPTPAPPAPPPPNQITTELPTNNLYVTGNSNLLDQFCFAHPESLLVFASGNEEKDIQPAGGNGVADARFLTEESTAKNVLTVGAVESVRNNDGFRNDWATFFTPPATPPGCTPIPAPYNNAAWAPLAVGAPGSFLMSDNADHIALFSNRGVVRRPGGGSTRRVKPDLVAPGTNILSLRSSQAPPPAPPAPQPSNVSRTENPALYQVLSGTSMATPHVSGAAILTRQYYRARFGQLRRPTLLEGVVVPPAPAPPAPPPPTPDFVDRPAASPHVDGLVFAWVTPALATDPKAITAARYSRELTGAQPATARLQADVGEHPAPALARHGEGTLLVHRHKDAGIRLSRYRRDLTPDTAFGTAGVVTLAPLSRQDDARPPALLVAGDEVAVAWADGGNDTLLFQRFNAGTGAAIDAAAITLGEMTHTAPHPYIAHTGSRYAIAWVHRSGASYRLQLRLVAANGTPVGAQPSTILQQEQEIREPQLVWDARGNRLVLVWCDARTNARGEVFLRFLDADGATVGAEVVVLRPAALRSVRRPLLAPHPEGGYVLLCEDDSQNGRYDVYITFLDGTGQPDGRIPPDPQDPLARRLVRVSDTAEDTRGLAAVVDGGGAAITWLSPDEINSDRLGAYAVNVTPQGAFQAQADPNTPLVASGRYVAHRLLEHADTILTSAAMAWAGGIYFLVRGAGGAGGAGLELHLVRTNADGRVDPTYGTNGARALPPGLLQGRHALRWTGTRLICATVDLVQGPSVALFDADGDPVRTFGTGGVQRINEPTAAIVTISPQVGHRTTPAFRVVLAYGAGPPGPTVIRYTVLNDRGGTVVAPRTLAPADGTARHGWFHVVNTENHAIAVWHRRVPGADIAVFANRYRPDGTAQHATDLRLTPVGVAAEESLNPAVAPRPVAINSTQREYGVVWQYRANATQAFEIRFSRLDRDGRVRATPPAPAPAVPTRDVRVVFPGAPGWPAATEAFDPQLVGTYTHEPWANVPSPLPPGTSLPPWSPSYGLAWLGQPTAGGARTLYFTVLDENGARAPLPQPPPNPPVAAPITQVSRSGVDVREFHLIWNGRTFRLAWTEVEGDAIRHMQTALSRQGSQVVHEQPSAALLRATLINGATNINRTALPNLTNGYGWGRVNLRQSLAPAPPVTYHVRDDNAVGPGRTARYRFQVPPGTALLRATLTWDDPPGAQLVNRLHLRVRLGGQVFQGNTWRPAPNDRLSRAVPAGTPFQTIHTTEQVVLENPPSGDCTVEVIAEVFPVNTFNQLNAQPFALVFVGSGPEVRFGGLPAGGIPVY